MTFKDDGNMLSALETRLDNLDFIRLNGIIAKAIGIVIESKGPDVRVGDLCEIRYRDSSSSLCAEVVGFNEDRVLLMPLGELADIGPGCDVVAVGQKLGVRVGPGLLGRVLNGLGEPIDDKGPVMAGDVYPLYARPPHPLLRKSVSSPLPVGVKAIDGMLTLGRGQRIGIFSGSGVGKSTLMGMMARNTEAEVSVIGLIGERGREVGEFLERDLGSSGLKRSVVVVATSDQPPLVRLKAALTATAIAEYFRDKGKDVLLLMDSITRVAMAQRDVGLAIGEPPATRGYTPSVFAFLPKLLERAGAGERGSITGIYNVLVEGDDMNEPVADTVRGILDGHIVLSRKLASKGHYPAIDILRSVSRVMPNIVSQKHLAAAQRVRELLAIYEDAEDLVNIGAYKVGSNPNIDWALKHLDDVLDFLSQPVEGSFGFEETVKLLSSLAPK
ncbi:flagellar protein export ATPase FliI [Acetomicrobium hydrogeniformans]|jgi:flagellum-specific ATP synthase|uniref:Flagellar protein export ATPase FliI n=1 Tax=Acetomicrobium hydrogeniformans ATCC BAA-1850 TaxID=592015 RepID=A0A0T5XBB9_9BACT|nr:flagellar protein export ATPase FliI [Acetomicrobium hydrogeniformans]KRT35606.1 flagellar protein export ATPase FliI [Acetomicrobium hydrogeniformans ATCC BAA-1850]